ncbi:MAG: histidine phosphatase family protein, partial [Candidatus Limnocylindrales bacterium]
MTRAVRLALIRHGESAWIAEGRFQGQGDPPLSAAGERQAAAVAARLAAPRAMPSLPVPDAPPLA